MQYCGGCIKPIEDPRAFHGTCEGIGGGFYLHENYLCCEEFARRHGLSVDDIVIGLVDLLPGRLKKVPV